MKAQTAQLTRYDRTAEQFERWLEAHPNADLRRQAEAFNSIADAEFYATRIKPVKAKRQPKAKV